MQHNNLGGLLERDTRIALSVLMSIHWSIFRLLQLIRKQTKINKEQMTNDKRIKLNKARK